MRGQIVVDLGLQGSGQHPPGTLAHDLVQVQAQLVIYSGAGDYTQHAAFLPRRRYPPALPGLVIREGTPRSHPHTRSTTSGHTS
jgi:hypothetical protein